ncbi:hypothetical protein ABDI30_24300 [Paenibacillus cisolokensis]|uniref:hypothetical protein n=1 Tax=Paenibacillus cisolokensis TaxID=1658519 RepID=UPI003D2C75DC
MSNWYKQIKNPEEKYDLDTFDADKLNFKIKTIETPQYDKLNIRELKNNIVYQWVVIPFLYSEQGKVFQIPVYHESMYKFICTHLGGYFNSVKGEYLNNNLSLIKLSELKDEIKNLIFEEIEADKNFINPIVKDFYLRESLSNSRGTIETIEYEIIIDEFIKKTIKSNSVVEDDMLWNFFDEAHLKSEGMMVLAPKNWIFSDSLLKSVFLTYISRYADRIILTVNIADQRIRAIEIR